MLENIVNTAGEKYEKVPCFYFSASYYCNYGKSVEYIKIPRDTLSRTDKITNLISLTNITRLTVTDFITIMSDYTAFYESPFVFIQSNDSLRVSLYTRSADYIIKEWSVKKRNILSVYYPPMVTYQYNIIGDFYLAGYVGYNEKIIFGAGISYQF